MHFREKLAWLTLASMLVAYSIYFGLVLQGHPAGKHVIPMLVLFGGITILQTIIIAVATSVIAIQSPKEAHQHADERDKAIARAGAHAGYYVLMIGFILVGVVMPFYETGVKLANTALLAIVLGETTRLVLILISYRRGSFG